MGISRSIIEEVLAERRRQVEKEGWTPEHDDQHDDVSLAAAAATYAWPIYLSELDRKAGFPLQWPRRWRWDWWWPKSRRRDLIRAAALIVAEIERLDRKDDAEAIKRGENPYA